VRNVCRCPVVQRIIHVLAVAVFVRDAAAQDSATIRVRIRSDSGYIIKYSLAAVLRQGSDSLRLVTRALADTAGTSTLRLIAGDSLLLSVRGIGYKEARRSLPARLPPDTTLDVSLAAESLGLAVTACDANYAAFRLWVPQAQADSTMPIHIVVRDRDFVERQDAVGQQARDHIYLAWGRPGEYDVEVSSPGYRTWSARRLVVQGTWCGPITRDLRVHLERR
jgi:hypothetical protein